MKKFTTYGSSRYTSIRIELLRHGPDQGMFRPDFSYMVQVGDKPVREFNVPLDQVQFYHHIQDLNSDANPDVRAKALEALSAVVTDVLELEDIGSPGTPVQIDLVLSAGELAALPFELAKDGAGRWLFARTDRDIEITRRNRLECEHRLTRWRAKPRVLFVAAAPSNLKIPADRHVAALKNALRPWIEPPKGLPQAAPPEAGILTIIEEASLDSIRAVCKEAADSGKPFTHVHFLAHGIAIGPSYDLRFGLALHGKSDGKIDAVEGSRIVDAMRPILDDVCVVTFAACHGGNETNTILPKFSLAQTFHGAGIPVVVCCQFPITVSGSTLFVEHFFASLFRGSDVRAALHSARGSLYEQRARIGHDWAGLVGYVRLPDTYPDHLIDVALEADLASLRTAQHWFDYVVTNPGPSGVPSPRVLGGIGTQIRDRIERLEHRRGHAEASGRKGVLEENLGLLGSAEKRLAEVHFRLWEVERTAERHAEMKHALARSHDWYRQAFRRNMSHHWSGVQMLALSAALGGVIEDREFWFGTLAAAKIAMEDPTDYWAAGTLAETYLLAPLAGQPEMLDRAADALKQLVDRTRMHAKDGFPIESTLRQLWRYRYWWTTENGFFGPGLDLTGEAGKLFGSLTPKAESSDLSAR
jgi:hypothetical protein